LNFAVCFLNKSCAEKGGFLSRRRVRQEYAADTKPCTTKKRQGEANHSPPEKIASVFKKPQGKFSLGNKEQSTVNYFFKKLDLINLFNKFIH
jgi:hypothetical protein